MNTSKWVLSGRNKLKLMLAMVLLAVLLFAANLFQKRQMANMDEYFSSIYQDRLVPAVSIFEIQERLYRKRELLREMLQSGNSRPAVQNGIDSCNREIAALLTDYKKTYFVGNETGHLKGLESSLQQYDLVESSTMRLAASGQMQEATRNYTENVGASFKTAALELSELSHIQSDVGKGIVSDSKKTAAHFLVLSNLETGLIVLFSVIAHILIYAMQAVVRRRMEPFNMN